ncbi:hypothetical protein CROQUDRAFT_88292 [Cronartium quercuum f. sp. fusiforme G11]|uniref:Uncharacterized protein n=1 Tax=Cronartium quercuum f. sp. fusiforme G11 TaxID=708437 RepID=A0A9P6NTZ2_9BASI|nr:hypothetical protein CROQUDRAFT_88292 [Cronartium quercuum f. sp. fusiforme G11]
MPLHHSERLRQNQEKHEMSLGWDPYVEEIKLNGWTSSGFIRTNPAPMKSQTPAQSTSNSGPTRNHSQNLGALPYL